MHNFTANNLIHGNTMNPLAEQLNSDVQSENPYVYEILSDFGKRIFFPTAGILAQAGDAKKNAHLYRQLWT